ncbi:MAG: chromate transporter [Nitrospirales bacterium]|nr:chromate transporter [Nitrospirales bacterium]
MNNAVSPAPPAPPLPPGEEEQDRTAPSLRTIFLAFLKIGALAFGGVYSILAFMERELVQRKKWINHEEFTEGVVVGQLTPGAPIVNTGIFIGYTLKKVKGAIATTLGQVLPSFVVILIISYLYVKYRDLAILRSVLKGIGGAVVGMVASVVLTMSKKSLCDIRSVSFCLAAFIALFALKLNPILVILASGIAGLIVYRRSATGAP